MPDTTPTSSTTDMPDTTPTSSTTDMPDTTPTSSTTAMPDTTPTSSTTAMPDTTPTSSTTDMPDTTPTSSTTDMPDTTPTSSTTDISDTTSRSTTDDMSDTNTMDLIYDTEMVSNILGVQSSTIRKYCTLMQKYGYEFNKNSVGHRVFYSRDIAVIKRIVELKNSSALTLTDAVQTILNSDIADITDIESIANPSYEKLLKQFEEFKNQQMEFNKTLLQQLEKQQEYIKNSINERDLKLLAAIKDSMETRKQIAESKRKLWWQFWKRGKN